MADDRASCEICAIARAPGAARPMARHLCEIRGGVGTVRERPLHNYMDSRVSTALMRALVKMHGVDAQKCLCKDFGCIEARFEEDFETSLATDKRLIDVIARCPGPVFAMNLNVVNPRNKNHANMLIVNRERRLLELFDPNVPKAWIDGAVRDRFMPRLERALGERWTFMGSAELYGDVGPQKILNEWMTRLPPTARALWSETCVLWSMLYLDFRLSHPDVDPRVVVSGLCDLLRRLRDPVRVIRIACTYFEMILEAEERAGRIDLSRHPF